jgi:Fe-Mn family superoxide dismutase
MQIEKHNLNIYPAFPVLLVLDMFEHAYYIDYKNDKAKYIEAFWQILDWAEVGRRYDGLRVI